LAASRILDQGNRNVIPIFPGEHVLFAAWKQTFLLALRVMRSGINLLVGR